MEINVESLYQQYGPMVLRRCRWLLKNEDKALDAMQDVFVQVLRKKTILKPQYLSSLLYRIATNICLNIIRFENRHPKTQNDELINRIASIDDFESRIHANDLIDRIFKEQKESTKVIAFLHLVDGLTLQEVANEVGMSVSGVRKRLRLLKSHAEFYKEY